MRLSDGIQKKNLIFLIGYGIYILSMTLELTPLQDTWDRELQVLRYGAYFLFILKIALDHYENKKTLLLLGLLVILAVVESFISGGRELVFMLLIFLALYRVDVRDALLLQASIQLSCMFMTFLLCILGIFPNVEIFDHGKIRYGMGFNYVTLAGELFLAFSLAFFYLRNKNIKMIEPICIIGIFLIIYFYTDSRTTVVMGIVLSLIMYLMKYIRRPLKDGAFARAFYGGIPIYITLLSWLLQLYYNDHCTQDAMQVLNRILNGRLQWAKQSIEEYGINVLGSDIHWVDNTSNLIRQRYNFVDNSYIKLVLDYGWIVGIAFLILYLYVMRCKIKETNRYACVLLSASLLYAFMTPVLADFRLNPLLLLAGGIFYEKPKVHQT
ncbi:MAG: hypothetical protein ACI4AA_06380 [Lachnospiraceae bacterium]